jgi:hypothetical protein
MIESRIGPDQRVSVADTVHARQFDDEMILLDLGAGEYFSLDAVGSLAWGGFAGGRSPQEIASEVVGQFDVDFDRALRDVIDLANELISRGLLVAGPP